MITFLVMLLATYSLHGADTLNHEALLLRLFQENNHISSTAINCQTPLNASTGKSTELKHATMMDTMTYEEMRSISQDNERKSLPSLRYSTLSLIELQALKETTQAKREAAESAWKEKFNEYCCQSTCIAGVTTSTGMLLGCFCPQILGLAIGPVKGCCLGGLASTPLCVCLLCYYSQTYNAELNKIMQESKNIDAAIQAKTMTE